MQISFSDFCLLSSFREKIFGTFSYVCLPYILFIHLYSYISEHIMVGHDGIPGVKMNGFLCLSCFYHIVKLVKHIEFFYAIAMF